METEPYVSLGAFVIYFFYQKQFQETLIIFFLHSL